MEQLKNMKEQITSAVQGQLCNLSEANSKELGEAVDMIKDLAEAIYYCTITEAMEKTEKEDKEKQPMNNYYYTTPYYRYPEYEPDIYYYGGRSMVGDGGNYTGTSRDSRMYRESVYPRTTDPHEGRSPISRKMYMEDKQNHQSTEIKMKDLEKYMVELTKDITEMIEDATPEEKTLLSQKISTLATKII